MRASLAENTRRAYEAALRGFESSGHPETDAGVAAYITGLYEKGRSAACAAMAVAALRFRARLHGRSSPVGPSAERALAGFRRLASERGRGTVAGVRWEVADLAAALAEGTGTPGGLRDAAIVAVASDALLRVSEVAALDIEDVTSRSRRCISAARRRTRRARASCSTWASRPSRASGLAGARGPRSGPGWRARGASGASSCTRGGGFGPGA